MIISTASKSLCKRYNADMKEKLACEIYELITGSGLLLVLNKMLQKASDYLKKYNLKFIKIKFGKL